MGGASGYQAVFLLVAVTGAGAAILTQFTGLAVGRKAAA
jgi:hypothetical protein